MTGPRLELVLRSRWLDHLEAENVQAWYHVARIRLRLLKWSLALHVPRRVRLLLAPRAYSRGDNSDQATPEDLVRVRWDVYELAAAFAEGSDESARARDAAWVVVHEYLHCLTDWTPTPEQLEELEHPTTAREGIRHAHRRGYPINAFTGLLRWNPEPRQQLVEALDWLRSAVPTHHRPAPGSA